MNNLYYFFSSDFSTVHSQWGVNWGWLPGSVGTLKPLKILGKHQSIKGSRILWRPGKYDLTIEHDSSDSSEDSDNYRRRLIRKLKRRLSKRRRLNIERKKANIMIEKLIRDKLLAKNKDKLKNGKNKGKNGQKQTHIHTIDKGNNQVRVISKSKLADKLRERFLTDYSYATAEEATASHDNIHVKKQLTVGGSDTNTATVESQNINNIPSVKQNQNTDIEELENEEETIHTSGGGKFPSSNTEEPEFEESTTVQHKTMQKTQYMSPQIINSASQSNYEQEIEEEETTTIGALTTQQHPPIKQTTKATKETTDEQEIEGVTKGSVTKATKQTTDEQEIEGVTTKGSVTKATTKSTGEQAIEGVTTKGSVTKATKSTGEQEIEGVPTKGSVTKATMKSTGEQEIEGVPTKGRVTKTATQTTGEIEGVTKHGNASKATNNVDQEIEAEETTTQSTQKSTASLTKNKQITHRFNSKGFAIGDTRANIAVENQHKTKLNVGYIPVKTTAKPNIQVSYEQKKPKPESFTNNGAFNFHGTNRDSITNQIPPKIKVFKTKENFKSIVKDFTVVGTSGVKTVKNTKDKIQQVHGNFPHQKETNALTKGNNAPKALGSNHPPVPGADAVLNVPGEEVVISEPGKSKSNLVVSSSSHAHSDAAVISAPEKSNDKHTVSTSTVKGAATGANVIGQAKGQSKSNKFLFSSTGKLGGGRRRVDDNGNVQVNSKPLTTKTVNTEKEKLEFSGNIFKHKPLLKTKGKIQTVSGKSTNVQVNTKTTAVRNAQNSLKSNKKHVADKVSVNVHGRTVNQNVIGKASVNVHGQKINQNRQILNTGVNDIQRSQLRHLPIPVKLQKHGITHLQPSTRQINKNNLQKGITNQQIGSGTEQGVTGLNLHRTKVGNGISSKLSQGNTLPSSKHVPVLSSNPVMNKKPKDKTFISSRLGLVGNQVKLGPVKILSSPLNNQIYAKHSQSGDSKTISHNWDLKQDNKTGHKIDRTQSTRTHTQAGTDKSGYSASNNKDTSIGTYSKRIAQPTTLQWHRIATSKPLMINVKDPNQNNVNNVGGIKWQHTATSSPVYTKKHININNIETPKQISWGPIATSRPVTTGKHIILQPGKKGFSWKQKPTSSPITSRRQTVTSIIKSGISETTNKTSPVTGDLLDRLRPQNTRNVGSNRGRLTIIDAGNSSKILPILNGQAKSQISNKIRADETLTTSWVNSMRPQAIELATELEGIWKGKNVF